MLRAVRERRIAKKIKRPWWRLGGGEGDKDLFI
jgi:hypothetical protein